MVVLVSGVKVDESELNVVANEAVAHGMLAPGFQAHPTTLECTFATFDSIAAVHLINGLPTIGAGPCIRCKPVEVATCQR